MSALSQLLSDAHHGRAFSGAAYAVGRHDRVLEHAVLGTLSWGGADVAEDTLWDLASLTKTIAAIACMALLERGVVRLDDTIGHFLPEWASSDKGGLTLGGLLTHTSGIPGQQPLYWRVHNADEMLAAIADLPLRFASGTDVEYTSQGFMVLGKILEVASEQTLDALLEELVFSPVGMRATCFKPADPTRVAATEQCAWRGRLVQGEVHDENAVVMGGVAAHAGLFSTLGDMALLCQAMLARGATQHGRVLSEPGVACMIEPRTRHLRLVRCLGWQGKDPTGSPAGDLFSARSFGHTGFTGTSVWMDPEMDVFAVLLTNRVHPTRDNEAIHRLRAVFHNVAVATYGSSD